LPSRSDGWIDSRLDLARPLAKVPEVSVAEMIGAGIAESKRDFAYVIDPLSKQFRGHLKPKAVQELLR
jgi:hypothetical protein